MMMVMMRPSKNHGVVHGYRSGLEKAIMEYLSNRGVPFTYESHRIPFTDPAKRRTYTPDFILPNGIVIESKGRFLSKDRQKHILIRQQHPELELRFVFSNAKSPIYKGSRTSLAQWAEKYGFQWADKFIPDAWIKEPVNLKWIKALERIAL